MREGFYGEGQSIRFRLIFAFWLTALPLSMFSASFLPVCLWTPFVFRKFSASFFVDILFLHGMPPHSFFTPPCRERPRNERPCLA